MGLNVLTEYSFIVVALGTVVLAIATSMVGSINILKGQSLIGDAVGHAAFPGIVLAFMLLGQKNSILLLSGAVVAGLCAFSIIEMITHTSQIHADTAMAVILAGFFGLGMVLKSYIQGNKHFVGGSQAGLATYIFGQAAYIIREDVIIIFIVALVSLLLFLFFYKEIKIHVFDSVYASTVGINSKWISFLIVSMTMLLIAAGLKAVGAILISSMLITPGVTGLQWSVRYDRVLIVAAVTGAASALIGTILSTLIDGMSTGPSIILVMSVIAFVSLLISPRGVIAVYMRRRKMGGGS